MAADAKINTRCFSDVLFLMEGLSAKQSLPPPLVSFKDLILL